jgi:hypothetical protein
MALDVRERAKAIELRLEDELGMIEGAGDAQQAHWTTARVNPKDTPLAALRNQFERWGRDHLPTEDPQQIGWVRML